MSTQRAEQRIANTMLRLAERGGKRHADRRLEILLPLTPKDVAALSATALYTASRVMSAWDRRGVLLSASHRVSIMRSTELTRIGEGA